METLLTIATIGLVIVLCVLAGWAELERRKLARVLANIRSVCSHPWSTGVAGGINCGVCGKVLERTSSLDEVNRRTLAEIRRNGGTIRRK